MPTQCGYFRILAKRPSRPLPSLTGSIPWPSAFFSLCLDRSVRSRGQNPGAKLIARVRQVLTDCFIFAAIYVLVMSVFLRLAAPFIVELFHAQGETAGLITFVCAHGGVLWLFLGAIFVANAAFNNLGFPVVSTLFNWGRATLGTLPFVTIGAARFGAEGGYIALIAGSALFGIGAVIAAYIVTGRLAKRPKVL